jgi:hypothetical protein
MAVIINEFEIITEPPSTPEEETPVAQAPGPPALRPEDIERIERRHRQRIARVWAD